MGRVVVAESELRAFLTGEESLHRARVDHGVLRWSLWLSVEQIGEALHKVGLDHLTEKVEEDAPWDQTLSGGEKQRLAFARLLLHNPDIVVLDEATSALDEKSQDQMMEVVISELPNATIVSVAHRVELEAYHSRKIVLERRKGGARLVSDIDLIPRKGKRRLLGRFLRQRKAPPKKAAG